MMSTSDPNIGSKDVTVAAALAGSERLIAKNFAGDPSTEADVRSTIGWTFYHLGHYDDAVKHLRRAVAIRTQIAGPADQKTIDDTTRLVTSIRWQYKPADALAIAEPAYRLAAATFGEEHRSTLAMLDNYAGALDDLGRISEAEPLYRKAVELNTKVLGPEADQTLSAMNNLAVVLIAQALGRIRTVAAQGDRNSRAQFQGGRVAYLTARHNLASVIANQGRSDEAIREFESTIADATQQLGEEHSKTLSTRVSYADALNQAGRAEEALAINRDVLARRMRSLGAGHEQTLVSQHNTINSMLATERFTEAEVASRTFIADADKNSPPEHMFRLVARAGSGHGAGGVRPAGGGRAASTRSNQCVHQAFRPRPPARAGPADQPREHAAGNRPCERSAGLAANGRRVAEAATRPDSKIGVPPQPWPHVDPRRPVRRRTARTSDCLGRIQL